MLKFEEWFKNNEFTKYPESHDDSERAWKAALTWAINNEFVIDEVHKELHSNNST